MRLRRAKNAREMYQLVADENNDNELLKVIDDYEQSDPWTHLTLMEQWKKLTLFITSSSHHHTSHEA